MSAAIQEAISRLAALYPYGELQASTDPAGFLHNVADELSRLRGDCARATVPLASEDPQRDAALEALRPFARLGKYYEETDTDPQTAATDWRRIGPRLYASDCLTALEKWREARPGEEP